VLLDALRTRDTALRYVLLAENEDARDDAHTQGFHAVILSPVRQSSLFDALAVAQEVSDADVSGVTEMRAVIPFPDIDPEQARKDNRLILLVEDNIMNQKVALHQLKQLGFAADIANDGQEALDALATVTYALVLMDCQMPVMDGFTTTRRIRQAEQSTGAHVQIVAMTANAMQGDRKRCMEAGMDDYIAKPIERRLLAAMLARRLPACHESSQSVSATPLMINMVRLCDMFGDDKTFQREMLALFISTTQPMLDQFESAIAHRNFVQIEAFAHRLEGSCANLGIDELAELARAVDCANRAKDLTRLHQLHNVMLAACARLSDFVDRMEKTL
jgi:CheY-like chemotaxis protein/HPt (histidine-containing phosphotransfer) domain-containing protein